MIFFCETEIETQRQRTNEWTPRGEDGAGTGLEAGIDTRALLILCTEQVTNEQPPYSTGGFTQAQRRPKQKGNAVRGTHACTQWVHWQSSRNQHHPGKQRCPMLLF